eukprot:TRINITY_DN2345_c0_g1_i1.p1 TRINITY_DN2345_c0_g1~~TRINITY_DN2345_c0_g1_i1.p1  ORF type:complete len:128 (+),score=13.69 TRINITY_DN2345_c0_g1_i1:712-1095(+)
MIEPSSNIEDQRSPRRMPVGSNRNGAIGNSSPRQPQNQSLMSHSFQEQSISSSSLFENTLNDNDYGGVTWYYKDPQGQIQGPFTPADMNQWLIHGFFPSDLFVSCTGPQGVYISLDDIINKVPRTLR